MQAKVRVNNFEYQFSDADVVNLDDFVSDSWDRNSKMKVFVLHESGFVQAVVFSEELQDAYDLAADAGKISQFKIEEFERGDYLDEKGEFGGDGRVSYLGNASEPYDLESLEYFTIPKPKVSFVALVNAAQQEQ